MNLTFKRIKAWPGKITPEIARLRPPKPVPFDETIVDLIKGLRAVDTMNAYIGLGLRPSEMRQDGWPRANAAPDFPGVYLLLDCNHGMMLLACDKYMSWLQNLRVLVETLTSLRQMEECGVADPEKLYAVFVRKGNRDWLQGPNFYEDLSRPRVPANWQGQSTYPPRSNIWDDWSRSSNTQDDIWDNAWAGGWKAASGPTRPKPPNPPKPPSRAEPPRRPKPPPPPPPPRPEPPKPPPPPPPPRPRAKETFDTRVEGAKWLASHTETDPMDLLASRDAFLAAYRKAARTLHPDVGGDPADFRRLQNAKEAIERGASWVK